MASQDGDIPEEMRNLNKWYGDAKDYWKNIPATVDGMLGGYSHISLNDVTGSKKFIKEFLEIPGNESPRMKLNVALDCGAGIGRVSKNLLLPMFKTVDMVEQNTEFLSAAKTYLGNQSDRVGNLFGVGLQEFDPEAGRYDAIWCQWVLGHLTDEDFVEFLKRCKKGLAIGGIIFVKENIAKKGIVVDKDDSSVTRSNSKLLKLFKKAELEVLKQETQTNFPKEIFKVNMYALQPTVLQNE